MTFLYCDRQNDLHTRLPVNVNVFYIDANVVAMVMLGVNMPLKSS